MIGHFIQCGQKCRFYFKSACFLISILLILCIHYSELIAQEETITIGTLSITGNTLLSEEELVSSVSIALPGTFRLRDFKNTISKLLNSYHERGYIAAVIDSVSLIPDAERDDYKANVYLTEGSIFLIGSVTLSGISEKEYNDIEDLLPDPNMIFTQNLAENTAAKITSYYEEIGYPYSLINNKLLNITSSDSLRKKHVDVEFAISKNSFVKIDSIIVKGLEYTQPKVVIREGRIKVGDSFRAQDIEQSHDYLLQLPYLSDVQMPELFEAENGKSILRYGVSEGKSNNFSGLIGYIPSTFGTNGYYIGTFAMDLGNLFGSGRRFQGEWQKLDRSSQKLRVFYEEPWVGGIPLSLSAQIEQSLQDSSYIKRAFILGAGYQLSSALQAHLSIGTEMVIAEELAKSEFGLSNSTGTLIQAGISYNKLDYRLNPRKGILYTTSVTHQKRKLNSENDIDKDNVTDKKINADFELAYPLQRRLVTYLHGAWNQTTSSEQRVPISEQWYLGGSSSLRGFREKQFIASKIAWYNLELRYLNSRDSRLFLFFDGGFFQNQGENSHNKFGYGFGFRTDSRIGMVGFDFGLSTQDEFSDGKIHFTVQNAF